MFAYCYGKILQLRKIVQQYLLQISEQLWKFPRHQKVWLGFWNKIRTQLSRISVLMAWYLCGYYKCTDMIGKICYYAPSVGDSVLNHVTALMPSVPVRKMIGRALLCCRASLQGTCKGNCSRISPTLMRFASPQMVCVVQSCSHIVFTLQMDLCTLASIFLCPLFRQYASSWSLKICPAMSIGMTTILREFASAVISDSLSFKMAFFLLKKNPNTRKHWFFYFFFFFLSILSFLRG